MSTSILTAFLARLSALALTPALPVIWPGLPKSPPASGMWLEARYFPNEGNDLTWGNDAQMDTIGFFQVSVYYRPGTNSGQHSQVDASEVADLVIAHFPKGLPIGPVRVRKSPWQSPAIDSEGKSFLPITIGYKGIIAVTGYSAP